MKNKFFKAAVAATIFSISSSASAGIIDISVNDVGIIQSIEDLSPEANIGFIVGESLSLRFTFNDAIVLTPADNIQITENGFYDANAQLWLTGLTSGVTLEYFSGLIIEVDDKQEFELEGIADSASAEFTSIIGGDIDWDTDGADLFSDITSLPSIFSELFANPFANNSANTASTRYWADDSSHMGMTFGHVPTISVFTKSQVTDVPEPTSLAILAVGILGFIARKKQAN